METIMRYLELLKLYVEMQEAIQSIIDDELPENEILRTIHLDYFAEDVIEIIEHLGYKVKFYDDCIALYKVDQ